MKIYINICLTVNKYLFSYSAVRKKYQAIEFSTMNNKSVTKLFSIILVIFSKREIVIVCLHIWYENFLAINCVNSDNAIK